FNRPAAKHALNLAMYREVCAALERASADVETRCVVVTGSESCFTAGNDLRDFQNLPLDSPDHPTLRFLRLLPTFPKPLLAAIDGPAVGIGTTMLLHFDLVYATARARFAMPFINLAVVPEAGSTLLLPQLCGHQRAAELLYFGEPFTAQTAREIGLVNDILPEKTILEDVLARAAKLAKKSPSVLMATKSLLRAPQREALDRVVEQEIAMFQEMLRGPECRKILTSFFERKK
ncbi:MAG: enoyl-CoA hydratase-related protein, partial [Nannocystaceae bacterium]